MSKTCIILANFGSTQLNGLKSILNIEKAIKNKFKNIPVKISFTSNIIRKIWKKRKNESEKWIEKGVPENILNVKGVIPTIGDVIEEEYENIIVQPTHIFYMEQVHDLFSIVKAFQSINTMQKKLKPFKRIVMGRPALGMFSEKYHYVDDIKKAVKTLKEDVEIAKKENASILYMAHGNEKFPSGIFYEVEKIFNEIYPEVKTFFSCVEGRPDFNEALARLNNKNVILKPFMVVAGIHAKEDMYEWKDILEKKRFNVNVVEKGLAENIEFAKIFASHIRDVAKDNEIEL